MCFSAGKNDPIDKREKPALSFSSADCVFGENVAHHPIPGYCDGYPPVHLMASPEC